MVTVFINNICGFINNSILIRRSHDKKVVCYVTTLNSVISRINGILVTTRPRKLHLWYKDLASVFKDAKVVAFEVFVGRNTNFQTLGEKMWKFIIENSKALLARKCIVCCIDREDRSTVVTCRRGKQTKKERKNRKSQTACVRQNHPCIPIATIFGS